MKTLTLRIDGMTCAGCQKRIEKSLIHTDGVQKAEVDYSTGAAIVTYDAKRCSSETIVNTIENLHYKVLTGDERQRTKVVRVVGLLVIIAALYVIVRQFEILNLLMPGALANERMDYLMLFVIGLTTSVHCIAMCGGINISQCIPRGDNARNSQISTFQPTFLYNLGRVISYTVVGFLVGALGAVFSLSNMAQGVLKLIAGVLMIIMGVGMLGIFPWLRKLIPQLPKFFNRGVAKEKAGRKSSLVVGLLNGLMPCGPLQAMQIYALSTGSPLAGALSMFLFSLGTVPLMFALGAASSALGKRFTKKVMTVGAVLVAVLGLSMLSQGLSLSGATLFDAPTFSANTQGISPANIENGVQMVGSTLLARGYPHITVEVGKPVIWTITAPEGSINGCNNRMIIQEYGIEYSFQPGDNVIEFTPTKTGKFPYSCWMGMIHGTITVVEAGGE